MDEPGIIIRALILGFTVAAPLGPTGVTVVRRSLSLGAWSGFGVGLGAALTDFVYFGATLAGLTPLIERVSWLPPALYIFGVALLGKMGIDAIRESRHDIHDVMVLTRGVAPIHDARWRDAVLLGIGVTIVNPAAISAWISLGGAFSAAHMAGQPITIGIAAMLAVATGSATWFAILSAVSGLGGASASRAPILIRSAGFASGIILLGFAAAFLWRAIDVIFG
ncbi:MAG: LysE family transporter [Thermomicrobiales bacterium]|mgnify:CR=1 FL=1|nr:LysE family transporter [Thermomicrobiales bacterium]